MFPTDAKTWALYAAITIGFAILSTALWEVLVKPASAYLGRKLVTLGTLGIRSASDSIYQDIARRAVHRPTLFMLYVIVAIMAFYTANHSYSFNQVKDSVLKEFRSGDWSEEAIAKESKIMRESLSPDPDSAIKEIGKIKDENIAKIIELRKQKKLLELAFLAMGTLVLIFVHAKHTYILGAIVYFDQIMAICEPHISDQDALVYKAEFAQMKNAKDFKKLLGSLLNRAQKSGVKLPEFNSL